MTTARQQASVLADLLLRERAALAEFLVALAGFDQRRAWEELGYASLFDYLHRDLGLSKGAAFYRMTAARLVQEHPSIVEPLRDGRLCLTTVVELSKVLTSENRDEVLPRFFRTSKREAREIMAELCPAPIVPLRTVATPVRALAPVLALSTPGPAPVHPANHDDLGQSVHPANQTDANQPAHPGNRTAPLPKLVVEPLTAELSRIHVTVSRRLLRKLDEARAALSHARLGATDEEILEAGLDLLLDRTARRRGLVKNPRKRGATVNADTAAAEPAVRATQTTANEPNRRYIPTAVRREVWERDGGRCQWPLEAGGICGSTLRVQLDHVVPLVRGGGATAKDLRCLCAVHNILAARRAFGERWMARFRRRTCRR
jgi:hypothetical protein